MRCRHRVSKLLLRHGRVYPEADDLDADAPPLARRAALRASRRPSSPTSTLLAAVDGLIARKAALDERLSQLATDGEWWPTVARLRCFRGIDTLTAFALCISRSATSAPLRAARAARGLARAGALARPVRRELDARARSPRPARARPPAAGRVGLALPAPATASARRCANRQRRPARSRPADRLARPAAPAPRPPPPARPRQAPQRRHRRRRPRARLLPLGRRHRRLTRADSPTAGRAGRRATRCRHARCSYEQPDTGHARS